MKRTIALTVLAVLLIFWGGITHVYALDQTNTSATKVIGQPDFTTNLNNLRGLRLPYEVRYFGGKLFIVESANRISVHNTLPTTNYSYGDWAIGQSNINERLYPGASAKYMGQVASMDSDGSKMVIADASYHRVLIHNTIPTSGADEADVVLGQSTFTTSTANNGGLSASSLNGPFAARIHDGKLYVADYSNNRVLIWNSIPTSNKTAADVVLGQPDMTSNTANNGGVSKHSLKNPKFITFDNNKMYVSDYGNHRILIWNTIPTTNNADADVVLGQPDFVSNTANNGGISAHSLNNPYGITAYGNKLYVSDYGNNRVLIFNTIPTTNQADANVVLGQPDMTSNTLNNGGISAHSLYNPTSADVVEGKLYVSDLSNARILIFNTIPTTNNASADLVMGRANFTLGGTAGISGPGADGGSNVFANAGRSVISEGKLLVFDSGKNRVLIWNNPESPSYPLNPDVIVGQPNIDSTAVNQGGTNPTASTLYNPMDGVICDSKLVISDYINYRVLIWNTIPTANNTPADVVLGQPDMVSKTANNGGLSAHSINLPIGVDCIGTKLLVADRSNNRILIWNTVPTTNNKDADAVLGQPDFTHSTSNNGGISAHSLSGPWDMKTDGTRLFVADANNNRVLVWNAFPADGTVNANVVLGQPDFTSSTKNNGGLSASSINSLYDVGFDGTRIYVTDSINGRVLIWDSIPTTNNAPADVVIGQADFTSAVLGISRTNLSLPYATSVYNGNLYISDDARILVFPFGAQNASVELPSPVADTDVTLQLSAVGAKEMIVSENSSFTGASWEAYSSTKAMTLSSGDGTKNVYAKYKDYANYEGAVLSATTTLDTTIPTGAITFASPAHSGYSNTRTVTLQLAADGTGTNVSQMKLSTDSSLVGANWETYATSKAFTFAAGDGVKTVYGKVKDAAGNESVIFSANIILDTVKPSIKISELGLITNVPDKSSLSYYFTSQTPRIKGVAEAGATVHFKYGSNDYTTTCDSNGSYDIELPELPRMIVTLSYYAVDRAGNQSAKRTLQLVIGVENFPTSSVKVVEPNEGESEETPTVTVTPSITPSIVVYGLQVVDSSNRQLANTKVYVNGQKYVSDNQGKIYLEAEPTAALTYEIEINGQKVKGTVLGDQLKAAAIQLVQTKNSLGWLWWVLGILGIGGAGIILLSKKGR